MMYDYRDMLQNLLSHQFPDPNYWDNDDTRQMIDLCAVKGVLRETRVRNFIANIKTVY